MNADAPMPVIIDPVTIPFDCGNQRPPVMNGIWYETPTPKPNKMEYRTKNVGKVVAYEAENIPAAIMNPPSTAVHRGPMNFSRIGPMGIPVICATKMSGKTKDASGPEAPGHCLMLIGK